MHRVPVDLLGRSELCVSLVARQQEVHCKLNKYPRLVVYKFLPSRRDRTSAAQEKSGLIRSPPDLLPFIFVLSTRLEP